MNGNPLMQSMGVSAPKAGGLFPPRLMAALQRAGTLNIAVQAFRAYQSGKLDEFAQQLYNSNPQFRQFADANKGKTLGQIAQENGVDLSRFSGLMK